MSGMYVPGVWIGRLGQMVECQWMTGMEVTPQDRVVHSGGAGSLSGPRSVSWGPAFREWAFDLSHGEPGELAALATLVHLQHTYGGSYRMLAVDAQRVNALTPAASMDFSGWSGTYALSGLFTAASEVVGGGTVLYATTPLEARTPLEGGPPAVSVESVAAITVTALSAAELVSPVVPVRPGHPVTLGIFAQGGVTLSARWTDDEGATLSTVPLVTATHADLQRLTPSTIAPAEASGVRLVVTGGTRYAWPSITWTAGPRRYAPGRGAEQVVLSTVPETLILSTPQRQFSSYSYTVREVA